MLRKYAHFSFLRLLQEALADSLDEIVFCLRIALKLSDKIILPINLFFYWILFHKEACTREKW